MTLLEKHCDEKDAEIKRLRRIVGDCECECHETGEVHAKVKQSLGRTKKQLATAEEMVAAARSYVDIRINHPQIAGEAWRDLVAALTPAEDVKE